MKLLKKLPRSFKHCACAYAALAAIAMLSGGCAVTLPEASIVDFQKARELVDQGTFKLDRGKLEEAETSYKVALEIAPIAAAYDGLGCVAMTRKQYSEALSYFQLAMDTDPEYTEVLGNLALLYESRGDLATAMDYYKQALEDDPKNFQVRNNFAAFLSDSPGRGQSSELREASMRELKKAKALSEHPIIENNIQRLTGIIHE